jgi:hypothetical protein
MQREHVVKLMAARADKPESVNLLRKVLRAMMRRSWAILHALYRLALVT